MDENDLEEKSPKSFIHASSSPGGAFTEEINNHKSSTRQSTTPKF